MAIFSSPLDQSNIDKSEIFFPKFDENGLIPCFVIEAETNFPLMVAYMNDEALARTIETSRAWYWSRSRQKLWQKGEQSGNIQHVIEMRTDCDQDVILIWVKVAGHGATCHTGRRSCFYRKIELGVSAQQAHLSFIDADRLFEPHTVYKN